MLQLFVQKGCMRLLSLPVWEEWIEILLREQERSNAESLPVWEEWIEIRSAGYNRQVNRVSSRMGRVD